VMCEDSLSLPPSALAAAAFRAARVHAGVLPAWPLLLTQLTGHNPTQPLVAEAIALLGR
jgi:hypothetical protein